MFVVVHIPAQGIGILSAARIYDARIAECREYAGMTRCFMLHSVDPEAPDPES
jgi:hypothetical protein